MLTEMSKKSSGRGRPRVADEVGKVTLAIEAGQLDLAEQLAGAYGELTGMPHHRNTVLRTAITRGLEVLRSDVEKMRSKT